MAKVVRVVLVVGKAVAVDSIVAKVAVVVSVQVKVTVVVSVQVKVVRAVAVVSGRAKAAVAVKADPVAPVLVAVKTRVDPAEAEIATPLPAKTSNQDTQSQKGRRRAALFLWLNTHMFMQHTLIATRLAKNT